LPELRLPEHRCVRFKRKMTLIGAILIHMIICNVYIWPIVEPYYISFYNGEHGDDISLEKNHSDVLLIMLSARSVFAVFGAAFNHRLKCNPKIILLIGMIFVSTITYLNPEKWYVLFILYGVVFQAGQGLMYWTPL